MSANVSPERLVRQVADEMAARRQLARTRPWLLELLGKVAVAAGAVFALQSLDLPFLAKLFVVLPATFLPGLLYEFIFLRRRLQAAAVLLGIPQTSAVIRPDRLLRRWAAGAGLLRHRNAMTDGSGALSPQQHAAMDAWARSVPARKPVGLIQVMERLLVPCLLFLLLEPVEMSILAKLALSIPALVFYPLLDEMNFQRARERAALALLQGADGGGKVHSPDS